jgi:hypothetical protein
MRRLFLALTACLGPVVVSPSARLVSSMASTCRRDQRPVRAARLLGDARTWLERSDVL